MTTRPWWSEPPSAQWVACCCSLDRRRLLWYKKKVSADARPHASQPPGPPHTRARTHAGRTPCPRGGARWAAARQAVWRAPRLPGALGRRASAAPGALCSARSRANVRRRNPAPARRRRARALRPCRCAELDRRKRGRGGVHPARQGVGGLAPLPAFEDDASYLGLRDGGIVPNVGRWVHKLSLQESA